MRNRGYVAHKGDLQAGGLQSADSGLTPLTRALNVHLYGAHTMLNRNLSGLIRSYASREGSALAGDFDIILTHDADSYESLPGYEKKTIRLNYWIDSAATATDPGWLWYYLTRDGQIGSTNTDVFTRISS